MAIKVRNLTKFYGTTRAIDDISFDVATGEILGFLGPNGAGKTTTMKIITCFMPPTAGTVEIDGYNIYEHSLEVRRKIGYLPELNPLYLDMNVMESLEFSARLQGLKNDTLRQRMKMMVDVCGLVNVRHKEVSELSKGFRQRLGLAQALVHDPDVLILDEPTSGLDPNQIVEIRNLIKKIGLAKTVILSTHILSEVQATCDRVIIINEGKIAADGKMNELAEEFKGSEFVSIELKASIGDAMVEIFPVLKELAGVDSVEFVNSHGDLHKFNLRSSKDTDIRESLYKLTQEKGWAILEMHRKVTSLEEVFHKLTKAAEK